MLDDSQINEWMDEFIWPQVFELMLSDAYFKLVRHVSQKTGKTIDPVWFLVLNGYVTFQLMGIRRLCDNGRGKISMRGLLRETDIAEKPALLAQLDACKAVCDQADSHIAHTGNPRRPEFTDWHLTEKDLADAHRAICKVTVALDRCRSNARSYAKIFPAGGVNMLQFGLPPKETQELWDFWQAHEETVNSWVIKTWADP